MNFEYSLTPINLNVTLLVCGVHYCAGTFFLWLFLLKIHLKEDPNFLTFHIYLWSVSSKVILEK